jgi:hypothetical protein
MKLKKTFTSALILAAALWAGAAPAATQSDLTGFPFTDEDLNYSIVWPSGINLGEAHLHATHTGQDWNLSFTYEAAVPGFPVKDTYKSQITADYCSTVFNRSTTHGSRSSEEQETIDRDHGTATRLNPKTGASVTIQAPACLKDALAYLFYSRFEMGQGRVPAAREFLFGDVHAIRVNYTGAPMITMNGKQVQTDMVTCGIQIGSNQYSFDVYYARDAARTPLLITVPLPVGKVSMELVR